MRPSGSKSDRDERGGRADEFRPSPFNTRKRPGLLRISRLDRDARRLNVASNPLIFRDFQGQYCLRPTPERIHRQALAILRGKGPAAYDRRLRAIPEAMEGCFGSDAAALDQLTAGGWVVWAGTGSGRIKPIFRGWKCAAAILREEGYRGGPGQSMVFDGY